MTSASLTPRADGIAIRQASQMPMSHASVIGMRGVAKRQFYHRSALNSKRPCEYVGPQNVGYGNLVYEPATCYFHAERFRR